MSARFLLRFDDICLTMPWTTWDKVEDILDAFKIKPLLAIIPANKDESLVMDPPRANFWERARVWQAKGWGIGLHGFEHRYVTNDGGIMGISPKSEFASLPRAEQREKIVKALSIFKEKEIVPDVFVAPSHSFDSATLSCLSELGLPAVSDGFAIRSYTDNDGRVWVPQQLWRFRNMPCGEWTVCFHAARWGEKELSSFESSLERFGDRCCSVHELLARGKGRKRSVCDVFFDRFWRIARSLKGGT